MDKRRYDEIVEVLENELVPALGCTEPIAVAYAAAKAREVLGKLPTSMVAECSGNIIKNVMGVIVPNSGGNRGVAIAAILGAIAGDASAKLSVLESVRPAHIAEAKRMEATGFCRCILAENVDNLYVCIHAAAGEDNAEVVIAGTHTNIVRVCRNNEVIFDTQKAEDRSGKTRKISSLSEIIEFAETARLDDIRALLDRQIRCNTEISEEGLKGRYGASIGKTLIRNGNADLSSRIKGKVAAGSDARMSGCSMPVVINSGSGNQGMAVSLPVIEYANECMLPKESLYRALLVSNLVSIYIKKKIGSLSAFCGASSAAAAAGAAIGYLKGWTERQIEEVVESTLVNVGGLICDGAKSTCAAKLATALDAMLTAIEMMEAGNHFGEKEGLKGACAEETVCNVCYVGRNGMSETDRNVLRIMTGEIVTQSHC